MAIDIMDLIRAAEGDKPVVPDVGEIQGQRPKGIDPKLMGLLEGADQKNPKRVAVTMNLAADEMGKLIYIIGQAVSSNKAGEDRLDNVAKIAKQGKEKVAPKVLEAVKKLYPELATEFKEAKEIAVGISVAGKTALEVIQKWNNQFRVDDEPGLFAELARLEGKVEVLTAQLEVIKLATKKSTEGTKYVSAALETLDVMDASIKKLMEVGPKGAGKTFVEERIPTIELRGPETPSTTPPEIEELLKGAYGGQKKVGAVAVADAPVAEEVTEEVAEEVTQSLEYNGNLILSALDAAQTHFQEAQDALKDLDLSMLQTTGGK